MRVQGGQSFTIVYSGGTAGKWHQPFAKQLVNDDELIIDF